MDKQRIIARLEANNIALERVALYGGCLTLADLPEGIKESTKEHTSCLIEVRENNKLIKELKE